MAETLHFKCRFCLHSSLCNDSFQRKNAFIFYFGCTGNFLCIGVMHAVNVNRTVCIVFQNLKRRKKVKNKYDKSFCKVQDAANLKHLLKKKPYSAPLNMFWHQQQHWWEKGKLRNPLSSWPQVNYKADMPNLFWQSALCSCMKKSYGTQQCIILALSKRKSNIFTLR